MTMPPEQVKAKAYLLEKGTQAPVARVLVANGRIVQTGPFSEIQPRDAGDPPAEAFGERPVESVEAPHLDRGAPRDALIADITPEEAAVRLREAR